MNLKERLKYYTLEKPVLFLLYIVVGLAIIGFFLCIKSVSLYQSYSGIIYIDGDKGMIEIQDEINNISGEKIYVYSDDLSEKMVLSEYEMVEDSIYFVMDGCKLSNEQTVEIKVESGQERLIDKILVDGGK